MPVPEDDPVVTDLEGGGGGGLDLAGAADDDPVVAAGSPLGHCLGIGISVWKDHLPSWMVKEVLLVLFIEEFGRFD